MKWDNERKALIVIEFVTVTPTNCRVAGKALNQRFKRWAVQ